MKKPKVVKLTTPNRSSAAERFRAEVRTILEQEDALLSQRNREDQSDTDHPELNGTRECHVALALQGAVAQGKMPSLAAEKAPRIEDALWAKQVEGTQDKKKDLDRLKDARQFGMALLVMAMLLAIICTQLPHDSRRWIFWAIVGVLAICGSAYVDRGRRSRPNVRSGAK